MGQLAEVVQHVWHHVLKEGQGLVGPLVGDLVSYEERYVSGIRCWLFGAGVVFAGRSSRHENDVSFEIGDLPAEVREVVDFEGLDGAQVCCWEGGVWETVALNLSPTKSSVTPGRRADAVPRKRHRRRRKERSK